MSVFKGKDAHLKNVWNQVEDKYLPPSAAAKRRSAEADDDSRKPVTATAVKAKVRAKPRAAGGRPAWRSLSSASTRPNAVSQPDPRHEAARLQRMRAVKSSVNTRLHPAVARKYGGAPTGKKNPYSQPVSRRSRHDRATSADSRPGPQGSRRPAPIGSAPARRPSEDERPRRGDAWAPEADTGSGKGRGKRTGAGTGVGVGAGAGAGAAVRGERRRAPVAAANAAAAADKRPSGRGGGHRQATRQAGPRPVAQSKPARSHGKGHPPPGVGARAGPGAPPRRTRHPDVAATRAKSVASVQQRLQPPSVPTDRHKLLDPPSPMPHHAHGRYRPDPSPVRSPARAGGSGSPPAVPLRSPPPSDAPALSLSPPPPPPPAPEQAPTSSSEKSTARPVVNTRPAPTPQDFGHRGHSLVDDALALHVTVLEEGGGDEEVDVGREEGDGPAHVTGQERKDGTGAGPRPHGLGRLPSAQLAAAAVAAATQALRQPLPTATSAAGGLDSTMHTVGSYADESFEADDDDNDDDDDDDGANPLHRAASPIQPMKDVLGSTLASDVYADDFEEEEDDDDADDDDDSDAQAYGSGSFDEDDDDD